MTRAAQQACRCGAMKLLYGRNFPHQEGDMCRDLRDREEDGADEWEEERRLDDRERAKDMNAISRNPWES